MHALIIMNDYLCDLKLNSIFCILRMEKKISFFLIILLLFYIFYIRFWDHKIYIEKYYILLLYRE